MFYLTRCVEQRNSQTAWSGPCEVWSLLHQERSNAEGCILRCCHFLLPGRAELIHVGAGHETIDERFVTLMGELRALGKVCREMLNGFVETFFGQHLVHQAQTQGLLSRDEVSAEQQIFGGGRSHQRNESADA